MNNTYLIDTHILLWWLANDKKLPKKMAALIADPANHIFVSAVSVWEISIKKSLKKLKAPSNLKEILETSGMELLSMTVDHALFVEHLPRIHDDPFDRLLIAQCMIEDMTFVSVDKTIEKYSVKHI